jgi:hypothetical protein
MSRSFVCPGYLNAPSIPNAVLVLTIDSFADLTVPASARRASMVSGMTITAVRDDVRIDALGVRALMGRPR